MHSSINPHMLFLSISGLISCLSSLVCAGVVLFSRPMNNTKIVWCMFCLFVAFWGFGYFKAHEVGDIGQSLFWYRFCSLYALFIPSFFVHFVDLFIGQTESISRENIVYYVLTVLLFLICLMFPQYYVLGVLPKLSLSYYLEGGFLYFIYTLFFYILSGYGILKLFSAYRQSTVLKKNQFKYILFGTAIGFGGGFTTFPLVFNIPLYPFGAILVPIYVLSASYAIVKYRLMDIRLAITRATVFLFVYMILLGVPLVIGFQYHLWMIATFMTLVLASFAPFAYTWARRAVEHKFFAHNSLFSLGGGRQHLFSFGAPLSVALLLVSWIG